MLDPVTKPLDPEVDRDRAHASCTRDSVRPRARIDAMSA